MKDLTILTVWGLLGFFEVFSRGFPSTTAEQLLTRVKHRAHRVWDSRVDRTMSEPPAVLHVGGGDPDQTMYSGNPGPVSKSNAKTTFLVPRTEKIQIAFTDGGREIQHNLHTDLLKLYKQVMEQLLERDQFIQTVQSLMEKTSNIDNVLERVRRLEIRYEHLRAGDTGRELEGTSGGARVTGSRETVDQDNSVIHGEGRDAGRKTMDERLDTIAKKVRRQQEEISRFQEEQRAHNKMIADQALELQKQREYGATLQQTIGKMEREIARNKQMTIAQAELLDHHANKMETQRTTSEVIDAKLGTVNTNVQWHDFRLGMLENTTSRLDSDYISMQVTMGEFHTSQRKVYGLVDKLQTDTERCHVNVATAKMKVRFLEQDVEKLLGMIAKSSSVNITTSGHRGNNGFLQTRHPLPNETLSGSSKVEVQDMIEEMTTFLHHSIQNINTTQQRLVLHNSRRQKQVDDVSLDLEVLKDESRNYFSELRKITGDLQSLKEYHVQWTNDRDKIRRKINKLEREGRGRETKWEPDTPVVTAGAESEDTAHARSTVGHQRRTTRSVEFVTPVAHEDTPEMTSADAGASSITFPTRHKSSTTDAVIKVTSKPVTENDADKGTLHEREEKKSTSDSEVMEETNRSKRANCTVVGIGKPTLVRIFPRILTGAWMKDPTKPNDKRIFVLRNNVKVNNIREYASEAALSDNNVTIVHHMPHKCTGTGHVAYKGSIYCNRYQTNRIMKYHVDTRDVTTARLRNAGFNNTFPYAAGAFTDIDFAVDESGLWAIYSTESDEGNIVIAKLDADSLFIEKTWVTTFLKTSAVNAFIVCGRLYATVYYHGRPIEVGYIYDTNTSRDIPVRPGEISFGDPDPDMHTSLDYNPLDARLYAWNLSQDWDGILMSYDVYFAGER